MGFSMLAQLTTVIQFLKGSDAKEEKLPKVIGDNIYLVSKSKH